MIQIPVNSICPNPYQPRTVFGQEEIERLAMSIRENGLLQPVAVRNKKNGEYELIAGERRLRATRYLGQTTISAIVVDTSSQQSAILALLENIQRQDLDFFEEAEAYYRLMQQWNMSQTQIAQKIGISQSAFANKIRPHLPSRQSFAEAKHGGGPAQSPETCDRGPAQRLSDGRHDRAHGAGKEGPEKAGLCHQRRAHLLQYHCQSHQNHAAERRGGPGGQAGDGSICGICGPDRQNLIWLFQLEATASAEII